MDNLKIKGEAFIYLINYLFFLIIFLLNIILLIYTSALK